MPQSTQTQLVFYPGRHLKIAALFNKSLALRYEIMDFSEKMDPMPQNLHEDIGPTRYPQASYEITNWNGKRTLEFHAEGLVGLVAQITNEGFHIKFMWGNLNIKAEEKILYSGYLSCTDPNRAYITRGNAAVDKRDHWLASTDPVEYVNSELRGRINIHSPEILDDRTWHWMQPLAGIARTDVEARLYQLFLLGLAAFMRNSVSVNPPRYVDS